MPDTQSTTTTRPLSAKDLEPVIAIDKAASGISRRGYYEKRLAAATDNPRDYVFVGVFEGDELAGFAFARLDKGAFGKKGATATLDAMGVRPDREVQGIGQQLLGEVEAILRRKGVSTLGSQVDWSHWPLLSFLAHRGFAMGSSVILARSTEAVPYRLEVPDEEAEPLEVDFSSPEGDDPGALSRDRIPVRAMTDKDLAKVIAIDRANTGNDRSAYFTRKLEEILQQSGVRVSLVAEEDGFPVGFIMARVDFGEFGHTSAEAVMDSIGVDPGFQHQGIGDALMAKLMMSLGALQVESVRTEVAWNDTALIGYLDRMGFAPTQRIALTKTL